MQLAAPPTGVATTRETAGAQQCSLLTNQSDGSAIRKLADDNATMSQADNASHFSMVLSSLGGLFRSFKVTVDTVTNVTNVVPPAEDRRSLKEHE
jgi:hypothetical protein